MSTHIPFPEKKLRDALAVAMTWEEFGKAFQEYRMTVRPSLSLRTMEHHPDFPSRSAISARETGKIAFTKQQIRVYLHECYATADLIDYCIKQHRRIAQSLQAARERSAAQASSDSASIINLPTRNTRPALGALAQGFGSQEIPDPEAQVERLLQRVESFEKSGEIRRAADTAAEAASSCDTMYGPDHPRTLYARAAELWMSSELFIRSRPAYEPLPKVSKWRLLAYREQEQLRSEQEQSLANRKQNARILRLRWETLIGQYRCVCGAGHRKTLDVSRGYVYYLRQGLGSHKLLLSNLVELIAEAEHSLGSKDNFPLRMRWWLAEIGGISWATLAGQFNKELGSAHPMATKASAEAGRESIEQFQAEMRRRDRGAYSPCPGFK